MSLYKQLWLAIAFLMGLAFLSGFVVSCLSAKAYLSEQLYRKNLDNVSSLALSLSSEERDPLTMELFINAQYDSGHYQYIRLEDTDGKLIAGQTDEGEMKAAPQWLMALFPIEVEPGIAQVTPWLETGGYVKPEQPDSLCLQAALGKCPALVLLLLRHCCCRWFDWHGCSEVDHQTVE